MRERCIKRRRERECVKRRVQKRRGEIAKSWRDEMHELEGRKGEKRYKEEGRSQ